MKINEFKDKKILFVRSAFIGDFIVVIPFIEYLVSNGIDKNNLHFLIINNNGYNPVGALFGDDFKQNTIIFNKSEPFLESFWTVKKKLSKMKIDIVFYLPFSKKVFFNEIQKYFFTNVLLPTKRIYGFKFFNSNKILASQYISLFHDYRIENTEIKNNFMEFLDIKPSRISDKFKIAIYSNSKLEMKKWPIENYIKLISMILDTSDDIELYLIGSVEDYLWNDNLISMLNYNNRIINTAGKYNIRETIELLSGFNLLIANDGSPIHFATIAGLPTIGLYTYKEPIGVWDPINKNCISFRFDVDCKECYKEFCEQPVCLMNIPVNVVYNEVKRRLNQFSDTNNSIQVLR